ncbi:MerR family transcriptional regulator [Thermodesulfobacteriota bacterium]
MRPTARDDPVDRRTGEVAMYTIGKLAKKFGLSRSTLLYYDSIGLLKPSSRSGSAYRQYSDADADRLGQICLYRQAGLRLEDIKAVLDSPENRLVPVLERRLDELNEDIERLRNQQLFIIKILKNSDLLQRARVVNAETWTKLLAACGFSREDMLEWHVEFENLSPDNHLRFLKFLRIPDHEIRTIRSWARTRTGSSGDLANDSD